MNDQPLELELAVALKTVEFGARKAPRRKSQVAALVAEVPE